MNGNIRRIMVDKLVKQYLNPRIAQGLALCGKTTAQQGPCARTQQGMGFFNWQGGYAILCQYKIQGAHQVTGGIGQSAVKVENEERGRSWCHAFG